MLFLELTERDVKRPMVSETCWEKIAGIEERKKMIEISHKRAGTTIKVSFPLLMQQ